MKKFLFVCLGNICRSPMGEGMMQFLIDKRNLTKMFAVDSAGTSAYHIGESADSRMIKKAEEHGVTLSSKARQISKDDFNNFDLILAMDRSNVDNIIELASQHSMDYSHVRLIRDFDSLADSKDVPDPYYGGEDGFEEVYRIMERSCSVILNNLEKGIL